MKEKTLSKMRVRQACNLLFLRESRTEVVKRKNSKKNIKLRQKTLAKELRDINGIGSEQMIRKWENPECGTAPRTEVLLAYQEIFGCTMDFLTGKSSDPGLTQEEEQRLKMEVLSKTDENIKRWEKEYWVKWITALFDNDHQRAETGFVSFPSLEKEDEKYKLTLSYNEENAWLYNEKQKALTYNDKRYATQLDEDQLVSLAKLLKTSIKTTVQAFIDRDKTEVL